MDLTGKLEKIKVDYNIVVKLTESVLTIHSNISKKYKDLTVKIANEVSYDEDTSEKITEKALSIISNKDKLKISGKKFKKFKRIIRANTF